MDFETIDRGVKARLALDMPEDQVKEWIAKQGWSFDLYRKVATEGARGVNAARTGIGQGMFMGWGDELEAGVRSVLPESVGGVPYEQGLKDARGGVAAFSTRNPKTAMGLQLGGALAPALATSGLTAPVSVGRSIAQGALVGSAGGAVTGAGLADGPMDERLRGALMGGALGGGVGGLTAGAIGGVASAARGMRQRAPALAARSLSEDGGVPAGTSTAAEVAALQKGKPLSLAEMSGPAGVTRLDAAITRAGKESSDVVKFLEERQAKSFDRIQSDLFDFVPEAAKGTARAQAREAIDAAKPAITAAYQRAYSIGVDQMPQTIETFRTIAGTPLGKEAWKRAKALAMNEGRKVVDDPPDMATVDYFKRALGDVIDKNVAVDMATGKTKATELGRQAQMMKQRLLSVADAENPDYQQARMLFQDSAEFKRAMEAGKKIGGKGIEAADLAEDLAKMAPDEQMAYRIGAVRQILADVGAESGPMTNRAKRALSPNMRAKLQAIEPAPGAADRLIEALGIESQMTQTTQKLLANSRTATRQANLAEIDEGVVSEFVSGGVPTSTGGIVDKLFARMVNYWNTSRQAGVTKATSAELAKRLGSSDPDEVAAVLREIQGLGSARRLPRTGPASLEAGIASGGLLSD